MTNKRHKPEEIAQKLGQVDVLAGQGMQRVDAIREVRVIDACSSTLFRANWCTSEKGKI